MHDTITEAMILCAGTGSRLKELTKDTPKVLLPIGNKCSLELVMDWLNTNGITEYAMNLHYLGKQIQEYIQSRNNKVYNNTAYIYEQSLLGTAGGVKNAGPFLGDRFVATFGDVLTNFNLKEMIAFHKQKRAAISIALAYDTDNRDHGIVSIDEADNKILSFREKPLCKTEGLYNAGTFVFEKKILDYIPDGVSDLGFDILPELIRMGFPIYGFVLPETDYVIDIGTPEGYLKAKEMYEIKYTKIPIDRE